MTDRRRGARPAPIVVKVGGSVLTGAKAYARAARWLEHTWAGGTPLGFGAPLLVVVSAEHGVTDRLLAEAEAISGTPDARALDLLWATGELRSAALLALHLQARGVAACALNVHETGLRQGGQRAVSAHLLRALDAHAVVIVPGFLATDDDEAIVSLGRGGSDLTAVTLAASVGASRCELIKDVPGYFTADPAQYAEARHIPSITVGDALAMARAGCALVQTAALEAARAHGVRLIIRASGADARYTTVLTEGDTDAIRHEDDSRRAAIGA
jgi:aspartate kinase